MYEHAPGPGEDGEHLNVSIDRVWDATKQKRDILVHDGAVLLERYYLLYALMQ